MIFNVSIENVCELGTVNHSMISLKCILSAWIPEKLSRCSEVKHTASLYSTQLLHVCVGRKGQVHTLQ